MAVCPIIEKSPHKLRNSFLVMRSKITKLFNLIEVSTFDVVYSDQVCCLHSLEESMLNKKLKWKKRNPKVCNRIYQPSARQEVTCPKWHKPKKIGKAKKEITISKLNFSYNYKNHKAGTVMG